MKINALDLRDLASQGRLDLEGEIDEESGYIMSINAEFDSAADFMDFYRRNFDNFLQKPERTVYGTSDEARNDVVEKDTWAVFRSVPYREDPDTGELEYVSGDWAVDVAKVLNMFTEDSYEGAIDALAASALYAVSRAESDMEVGSDSYDFHLGLVQEEGPVRIAVEEEEVAEERSLEEAAEEELEEGEGREIDYEVILSGTVSNTRERIETLEDDLDREDYEKFLELEKEGDDRKGVKEFLEDRLEEERDQEDQG